MFLFEKIFLSILVFFIIMSFVFGIKNIFFDKALSFKNIDKNQYYSRGVNFINRLIVSYEKRKKILFSVMSIVFISIFYLIFRNLIFSFFISTCVIIFIFDLIKKYRDKRNDLIHSQLIEFINNMIIMLKAGRTIRSIFKESLIWVKKPLREYLYELVGELELNFTLDEALERFSDRCESREVRLLTSALKINNKIGGDLIFILKNIVDTLQHSLKAKSQIRTMTLQSRYSGNIISFFPILVLTGLFFFMNDAVSPFFSSSFGNILLILGGLLEIAGILVIRNILNINIGK